MKKDARAAAGLVTSTDCDVDGGSDVIVSAGSSTDLVDGKIGWKLDVGPNDGDVDDMFNVDDGGFDGMFNVDDGSDDDSSGGNTSGRTSGSDGGDRSSRDGGNGGDNGGGCDGGEGASVRLSAVRDDDADSVATCAAGAGTAGNGVVKMEGNEGGAGDCAIGGSI